MTRKSGFPQVYSDLVGAFSDAVPQVSSLLGKDDEFISLLFKARTDGTTLAVLKRHGSDGGPLVGFGSGYGVIGAFMALEGTIASGSWKIDKPYDPSSS